MPISTAPTMRLTSHSERTLKRRRSLFTKYVTTYHHLNAPAKMAN